MYADANDSRLVDLGVIALFSNFNLTTSSGKHFEDISQAPKVSLMYKLITCAETSHEFSIGLQRDRVRAQRETIINKNVEGKFDIKFMLKDDFGFAELQKLVTYGVGYRLALTRNKDDVI